MFFNFLLAVYAVVLVYITIAIPEWDCLPFFLWLIQILRGFCLLSGTFSWKLLSQAFNYFSLVPWLNAQLSHFLSTEVYIIILLRYSPSRSFTSFEFNNTRYCCKKFYSRNYCKPFWWIISFVFILALKKLFWIDWTGNVAGSNRSCFFSMMEVTSNLGNLLKSFSYCSFFSAFSLVTKYFVAYEQARMIWSQESFFRWFQIYSVLPSDRQALSSHSLLKVRQ